ncbi:MAG: ASCH domain-containing protein [Verrucomicrobiota bacterium]|nr:ASCH domain-containing protein [Verrucomicrobiota bacterium]
MMDSCAWQVLLDKKHATSGLLAAFLHDKEPLPTVGQHSTVCDGQGRPIAIIETIQVEIRKYSAVDEAYAAVEGEGDGSLREWQALHWDYLNDECKRVGYPMSCDVELVLETFRLVERLIAVEDF